MTTEAAAERWCPDDRGLGQWPAWKNGVEVNKGLEAQFTQQTYPFYSEGILVVTVREKVVGFITRFLLLWRRHREMVVEMADLSKP